MLAREEGLFLNARMNAFLVVVEEMWRIPAGSAATVPGEIFETHK